MSGKRILYGYQASSPVRAVLLTLKALDLDFSFEIVNTMLGDTLKSEFIAKNPQHTVPTLEEADGTCIWDSHAICAYLVRKYGKDDALYPKDFYRRAVVDQRLHFENGVMYSSLTQIFGALFSGKITKAELQDRLNKLHETYDLLEKFLGDNQFMAGSSVTIADFSIVTTLYNLAFVAPIIAEKWPKLTAWLERLSQLPYYEEINTKGFEIIEKLTKEKVQLLQ